MASLTKGTEMSADEWMAQVRAWAASFPQRDYIVDDSREALCERDVWHGDAEGE